MAAAAAEKEAHTHLIEAAFKLDPKEREIAVGEGSRETDIMLMSHAHKYGITRIRFEGPPYLNKIFEASDSPLHGFLHLKFNIGFAGIPTLLALFPNAISLTIDLLSDEQPAIVLSEFAQVLADERLLTRLQSIFLVIPTLDSPTSFGKLWAAVSERKSLREMTWLVDSFPFPAFPFDQVLPPSFPYITRLRCNLPFLKQLDARFPALVDYTADLTVSEELRGNEEKYYTALNEELVYFLQARQKTLESFDVTWQDTDDPLPDDKIPLLQFEKLHTWKAKTLEHHVLETIMAKSVVGPQNKTVRTFHWQSGENVHGADWDGPPVWKSIQQDRVVHDLQLITHAFGEREDKIPAAERLPATSDWLMPISRLSIRPWMIRGDDTQLRGLTELTRLELVRTTAQYCAATVPSLFAAHPNLQELHIQTHQKVAEKDASAITSALANVSPNLRTFSWTLGMGKTPMEDRVNWQLEKNEDTPSSIRRNRVQAHFLDVLSKNQGLVSFTCSLFHGFRHILPPGSAAIEKTAIELAQSFELFLYDNQTLVQLDLRLALDLEEYSKAIRKENTALEYVLGSKIQENGADPYTPIEVQDTCVQRRLDRERRLRLWAPAAVITRAMLSGPEGKRFGTGFAPLMKNISELADIPYTPDATTYSKKAAEKVLYRLHAQAPPDARMVVERDTVVRDALQTSSSSSSSSMIRSRKRKPRR